MRRFFSVVFDKYIDFIDAYAKVDENEWEQLYEEKNYVNY